MNFVKNNWKVLVAAVLFLVSIVILMTGYVPGLTAFKSEEAQLSSAVVQLETTIAENMRYESVQKLLDPATRALEVSRRALYQRFPADLLEEDQIMYVLYLEEKFGTEINFNFGTKNPLVYFTDGAILNGLTLTINYEDTYDGFKEMINYLATDERVTSIQYATMTYDAEEDIVKGNLTLMLYMVDSSMVDYYSPTITPSEQGKDNIFEGSVLTPEDVKEAVDGEGSADRPDKDDEEEVQKAPNNSAEGVIPGYVDPNLDKNTMTDRNNAGTSTGSSSSDIASRKGWVSKNNKAVVHLDKTCKNLSNPKEILLIDAIEQGYKACSVCAGGTSSDTSSSSGSTSSGSTTSTSDDGRYGYGSGTADDGSGFFDFVWGM